MGNQTIIAISVDENSLLNLDELSHAVHVEPQFIVEMVEYQLIEPQGDEPKGWRFNSQNLHRAQVALRLHRDLEIDLPALGLALDLLEKIHTLEKRVKILEKLIPSI